MKKTYFPQVFLSEGGGGVKAKAGRQARWKGKMKEGTQENEGNEVGKRELMHVKK